MNCLQEYLPFYYSIHLYELNHESFTRKCITLSSAFSYFSTCFAKIFIKIYDPIGSNSMEN